MKFYFTRGVVIGLLGAGLAISASAQTLVFDRGLPTINLNNAAGSNRSNVAWADGAPDFTGDDFTLAGTGNYNVTTIRTWLVGDAASANGQFSDLYSGLTLWLGSGGNDPLSATTYGFSAHKVSYAGGGTYQSTSGTMRDLWEIDWDVSGLSLTGGVTEFFGVSGITNAQGAFGTNNWVFNHASNAALSGSTQQGANGLFGNWNAGTGAFDGNLDSNGNGWDKSSDINVQVFAANATPEPFTMSLGLAGAGLFIRRRMKAKKA